MKLKIGLFQVQNNSITLTADEWRAIIAENAATIQAFARNVPQPNPTNILFALGILDRMKLQVLAWQAALPLQQSEQPAPNGHSPELVAAFPKKRGRKLGSKNKRPEAVVQ